MPSKFIKCVKLLVKILNLITQLRYSSFLPLFETNACCHPWHFFKKLAKNVYKQENKVYYVITRNKVAKKSATIAAQNIHTHTKQETEELTF